MVITVVTRDKIWDNCCEREIKRNSICIVTTKTHPKSKCLRVHDIQRKGRLLCLRIIIELNATFDGTYNNSDIQIVDTALRHVGRWVILVFRIYTT